MNGLAAGSAPAFVLSLAAGLVLDLALGDPPVRWHPVRLIGALAARTETAARGLSKGRAERTAGALAWAAVMAVCVGLALAASCLAWAAHPWAGVAADALLLWASMAPTDLSRHASRVQRALLSAGPLDEPAAAREAVSMMVGRDVSRASRVDISRACVESVAESSVDGVCAPVFWGALLGPWAACAYRAVNTMDSMFGHKDQRYLRFGTVAARADDAANFLPARLSGPLIALCAPVAGGSVTASLNSLRRHRLEHASPNAGHPESAYAGALGVRLGGPVTYAEGRAERPWIYPGGREPGAVDIARARRLLWAQTLAWCCLCAAARCMVSVLA
ncbi:MAG: cobalamin biosynthesis protein CobD [Spirochaetia bacterium]|nr:cobalamin biosynthesis protein CobD [Spirochaetia bacterium]